MKFTSETVIAILSLAIHDVKLQNDSHMIIHIQDLLRDAICI